MFRILSFFFISILFCNNPSEPFCLFLIVPSYIGNLRIYSPFINTLIIWYHLRSESSRVCKSHPTINIFRIVPWNAPISRCFLITWISFDSSLLTSWWRFGSIISLWWILNSSRFVNSCGRPHIRRILSWKWWSLVSLTIERRLKWVSTLRIVLNSFHWFQNVFHCLLIHLLSSCKWPWNHSSTRVCSQLW